MSQDLPKVTRLKYPSHDLNCHHPATPPVWFLVVDVSPCSEEGERSPDLRRWGVCTGWEAVGSLPALSWHFKGTLAKCTQWAPGGRCPSKRSPTLWTPLWPSGCPPARQEHPHLVRLPCLVLVLG